MFGKIIDGFDTLDALERCQVNDKHRPLSEIRLRSVTVHANPLAVRPSSTLSAAAVHLTHKGGPSRVAGPDDHLPVRQRGPGHPRVKGHGGQKGRRLREARQSPRGCGRPKLRCDAWASLLPPATSPSPSHWGAPIGHQGEPLDRRRPNLTARRQLDTLRGHHCSTVLPLQ